MKIICDKKESIDFKTAVEMMPSTMYGKCYFESKNLGILYDRVQNFLVKKEDLEKVMRLCVDARKEYDKAYAKVEEFYFEDNEILSWWKKFLEERRI